MKKKYIKPEIEIVDLRPEEQIGWNCSKIYVGNKEFQVGQNPNCHFDHFANSSS